MDKVDDMQEYIDNGSRKMEILKKNQKEMQEIKNTLTGRMNAFDRLINRLDMAEEQISKLEDISIKYCKTEKKKKKENIQEL